MTSEGDIRRFLQSQPPAAPSQTPAAPTASEEDVRSLLAATPQPAPQAKGLLAPGNIDLYHRPHVQNPDGTVSTVRSMSFEQNGREVLVPTVSDDGRIMSNDEAIDTFHKTGKHLGMFDNAADANRFAEQLHNEYAAGKYDQPQTPATPAEQKGDLRTLYDTAKEDLMALMRETQSGSAGTGAPARPDISPIVKAPEQPGDMGRAGRAAGALAFPGFTAAETAIAGGLNAIGGSDHPLTEGYQKGSFRGLLHAAGTEGDFDQFEQKHPAVGGLLDLLAPLVTGMPAQGAISLLKGGERSVAETAARAAAEHAPEPVVGPKPAPAPQPLHELDPMKGRDIPTLSDDDLKKLKTDVLANPTGKTEELVRQDLDRVNQEIAARKVAKKPVPEPAPVAEAPAEPAPPPPAAPEVPAQPAPVAPSPPKIVKGSLEDQTNRYGRAITQSTVEAADAEAAGPQVRKMFEQGTTDSAVGAVGTGKGAFARGRLTQAMERAAAAKEAIEAAGHTVPDPDVAVLHAAEHDIEVLPGSVRDDVLMLKDIPDSELLSHVDRHDTYAARNLDSPTALLRRALYSGEAKRRGLLEMQPGEIHPKLLSMLGRGALGAAGGAVIDRDHPLRGALIGGVAAAAGPEAIEHMQGDRPGFAQLYSRLEGAIKDAPQESALGSQWHGMLSNAPKGVWKAERDWTGINEFLNANADRVLTKDEVLGAAKKRAIKIGETVTPSKAVDRSGTRTHESYSEPGGDNYREIKLQLDSPEHDGDAAFTSPHHDEPNILAHARVKDRVLPNGEKVLYAEELQSDWAQRGRQSGYAKPDAFKSTPELDAIGSKLLDAHDRAFRTQEPGAFDAYEKLAHQYSDLRDRLGKFPDAVPETPYKRTDEWTSLAMKRLVDEAAKGGYDRIAWTPGELQAKRYPEAKGVEGVAHYYDHIVPNVVHDYGKKLGVPLQIEPMSHPGTSVHNSPSFRVTPELRAAVKNGQPLGIGSPRAIADVAGGAIGAAAGGSQGDSTKEHLENAVLGGAAGVAAAEGARALGHAFANTEHVVDRVDETKGLLRQMEAEKGRRGDIDVAALAEHRERYDKMPKARALALIDDIEHGRTPKDPKDAELAKTLRKILDTRRTEVQALGNGKLQQFYENYFPHIWNDPDQSTVGKILGKRPIEGSKSFLKQRSIPTIADGIAAGLEPVTYNPVDMVLLKAREMDRYIMGQKLIADMKGRGLVKYVPAMQKAPEGYGRINDNMFQVSGGPTLRVHEAVDGPMMKQLQDFMTSIGVSHERLPSLKRQKGQGGAAWGLAYGSSKVESRFGGPESVITHEIGHILDSKYNLQRTMAPFEDQLKKLAMERVEGMTNVPASHEAYILKPEERIANLVHAYVHAPERAAAIAPDAVDALRSVIKKHPELAPLDRIKPSLALQANSTNVPVGGLIKRGEYMAPQDVADLLNRHLAPGIIGNRNVPGAARTAFSLVQRSNNAVNAAQLSLSAFHAMAESINSVVSDVSLAMQRASRGDAKGALEHLAMAPIAPARQFIRGGRFLKEWEKPGTLPAEIGERISQLAKGGYHAHADDAFRMNSVRAFDQALSESTVSKRMTKALPHVPGAVVETMAKPIMEKLVPRLKIAAAHDIVKHTMEDLAQKGVTDPAEIRDALYEAVRSVDNRFGQLALDNLFWNRTVRDLAGVGIRSRGWTYGTLSEIGGGLKDLKDIRARGVSHRTSYTAALGVTVGIMGGALNYLMTGEAPREAKDYFFPRTGKERIDGTPDRVALPTYMKDVYAFANHPVETLLHKVGPLAAIASDLYHNEDFYGQQIHTPDSGVLNEARETGEYLTRSAQPFGVRGVKELDTEGKKALLPLVGITPAPASVTRTRFENYVADRYGEEIPSGGRTAQQVERSAKVAAASRALRNGASPDLSGFTDADMTRVNKLASSSSDVRRFRRLRLPDQIRAFELATPEERTKLGLQGLIFSPTLDERLGNLDPEEATSVRQQLSNLMRPRDDKWHLPFSRGDAAGQKKR